ncbi:MAG: site-specific integrase [Acetobacteraceae bacterium]
MTVRGLVPIVSAAAVLSCPAPGHVVPALIAEAREQEAWRYLEFFSAYIRNPNTRRAYARACAAFFQWCEQRGLTLAEIRSDDVGADVGRQQRTAAAPSVKQSLAAIRMLFD